MPRKRPEPFWRTQTRCFYVKLHGKQLRLDPDEPTAWRIYHELMARPPEQRQPQPRDTPTLAVEILDAFLEWAKANKAKRTYEWYQGLIQHFVSSIPATIAVAELTPYHATRVMDGHPEWGANTKYAFARAVLRGFNWAVKQRLIAANPLSGLEKPTPEARELYISPADYAEVMAAAKGDYFRDVLRFAWESGARPQEIRAIEARHVDFTLGRIVFPKSEAKGKRSARIIYLTDEAAAILKPLCAKYPTGVVFRNSDGNPWTKDAINCAFKRLEDKIGRKLHLGAFRKGWATQALKNGVDVVTASHLMGHANTNMLSKHYARVQADPAFMTEAMKRARGG